MDRTDALDELGALYAHDPECTGCVHECPWLNRPLGAPYCQTCDDHYEASGGAE